jgi:repressor LexA
MTDLGNKAVFSSNLQFYMNKFHKDRNQLCEELHIKYSTLSDWINGNKYPRIDKIEILANYFGIEKSDLIEKRDNSTASKGVLIPVLGYVRAGIPIEAVEEILDYEEISKEDAAKGDHFGLVIKGDSMEPKFSEGDVVIVRKQETVENGEIAVVLINGDDATVKRFYLSDNGIKLVSTNPKYDPFFYTPEEVNSLPVQIIGRVIELRAKF